MLDSIKNRPPNELLAKYTELYWWEEAVKQAQRSTFNRHRTGAVIVDYRGTLRSKGCSHKRDGLRVNSLHAEKHAIGNFYDKPSVSAYCVIVTLTKANNFAGCSRPCYDCAWALQACGLDTIYAERTNDGGWAIREVQYHDLTQGYLKPTRYT